MHGKRNAGSQFQQVRPMLEQLEPRLLLDGAVGEVAIELFEASPAVFVENQGQWDDASLHYMFQGSGANIAFTDDGPVFQVFRREPTDETGSDDEPAGLRLDDPFGEREDFITHATQFSVHFDGSDTVTPVGLSESDSKFNYFIGDQVDWRAGVSAYEVVAYENLYDGIDLHTWGRRNSLKYEFYVAPGADYRAIQVSYDGIEGLYLDDAGALHVQTELGELIDDAPYIYQVIEGEQVEVAGSFELIDADTYTFAITGEYDGDIELIIDPDLSWSSYLGGSGSDIGRGIATDAAGNAFLTGGTYSSDFPTPGGFDTSHNGYYDAFVAKVGSSGSLLWSSYLGGSDLDSGYGIATDAAGNAFLTGLTYSYDFPTPGGFDTSLGGDYDAFVAKVGPSGSLLWSSYLGGSVDDCGYGIATDAAGNAFLTGWTGSSDFPTPGGFDTSYNGGYDAFVAKVGPSGSLLWSSYLGGSDWDSGYGIATDAAGNAFLTGYTYSSDFPTPGGFDTSYNGGYDAFVAKVGPSGSLLWSSYLGGSVDDCGYGIATDASGNAFLTGWTGSSDFPTPGGFDTSYNGGYDAFVAKVGPSGSLLWSSYLGGSGSDYGFGIATDAAGNAFLTGYTYSSDFPTPGGFDTSYNGVRDAFVAKVGSSGSLLWSSYLGGSRDDSGRGIATDAAGNAFLTGWTGSSDFPTPGGFDTSLDGFYDYDAFVAKITDLHGDLDGDGFVGQDDLDIVLGDWGNTVPPADPTADPSGDDFVGQDDLDTVLGDWGAGAAPAGGAMLAGIAAASSEQVIALASEDSAVLSEKVSGPAPVTGSEVMPVAKESVGVVPPIGGAFERLILSARRYAATARSMESGLAANIPDSGVAGPADILLGPAKNHVNWDGLPAEAGLASNASAEPWFFNAAEEDAGDNMAGSEPALDSILDELDPLEIPNLRLLAAV